MQNVKVLKDRNVIVQISEKKGFPPPPPFLPPPGENVFIANFLHEQKLSLPKLCIY